MNDLGERVMVGIFCLCGVVVVGLMVMICFQAVASVRCMDTLQQGAACPNGTRATQVGGATWCLCR